MRLRLGTGLLVSCLVLMGGCNSDMRLSLMGRGSDEEKLQKELTETRNELQDARETLSGMQTVVVEQQKQIKSLQDLGPRRLESLYHVKGITLGRYTGPADFDGQPGSDGLKVYLRTIDQTGDAIKAAGQVSVQLFDLALPAEKNLIGEYHWDTEKLSKTFSGGFMTYHYTLKCPFVAKPQNPEITVRVTFIDYLTGKHFSTQKVCKITE